MSFTIFQNEKTPFQAIKSRSLKKSKNCHFSKGVNPWFWSKNGHFSNFFFLGNIGQENVFKIFYNEKTPFQAIKTRRSKSRKIAFFSKRVNQRFWSKNWHFSNFFFSGNIGQQYVFQDILERKKFFLAYKNKKFKKSKNCLFFPRGLTQGLGPKMAIFPTLFFQAMQARKMSLRYSTTKKRLSSL